MDKTDRSPDEDLEMIHTVHASRYHWSKIGKPMNFERGEWQISRVYSILNRPKSALYHAQKCLDICLEEKIGDFDIAFAYEAMARAHTIAGNTKESDKYLKLGKEAGEKIAKKKDKEYFFSELDKIH